MTDRGANTLAARGLEEPFFPIVLLCQFLILENTGFGGLNGGGTIRLPPPNCLHE
jgi:hypothetical protein